MLNRSLQLFFLSERRDLNPRPSAWKANALSTELLSQFTPMSPKGDFYPPLGDWGLWAVKDLNLRSRKTAELQSAPVDHFGNYPLFLKQSKDIFNNRLYQTIFAIFRTVVAASMPLFPCFPPARSNACCKVLVVRTPKTTGQEFA